MAQLAWGLQMETKVVASRVLMAQLVLGLQTDDKVAISTTLKGMSFENKLLLHFVSFISA